MRIEPAVWPQYAQRPETRREHLAELQTWLNLKPFSAADYRRVVHQLSELAQQTDRGMVLPHAHRSWRPAARGAGPSPPLQSRPAPGARVRDRPGPRPDPAGQ
ncbi:DUF4158 domain-containing protein [Pseudoxanthomonas spadix]|nr:DUF4158 domain-containing protein [Pseudoxanthomonas spadix]